MRHIYAMQRETTTATNATTLTTLTREWRERINAMQRERETDVQRAQRERMAKQRVGVPPRNVDRVVRPNEWERNGPRNVHRETDRACHHPLVNCVHKW